MTAKPSAKAAALSARLSAVQATYQIMQNEKPVKEVLLQYLQDAGKEEIDGEKMVEPDEGLLKKILLGVDKKALELETILKANYKQDKEEKSHLEPLLQAILLCGAYELFSHQDVDSPIIINDYLNVTHGFYEQGEVSLVNGILDSVSAVVRS